MRDRILITGGAGFIGSHLAERLLREGKRVAIVDNLDDYYPAEAKRANLEEVRRVGELLFFSADIRKEKDLLQAFAAFKPDVVVHLAARPGVRLSFSQPSLYASINVLGTVEVLEASRRSGVEDADISHPLSIYAATKVAGEALAYTYSHAYALSVACLRLFTVYGPRQRPDLAIRKFAGLILEGKEVPIFGDGSLERDFTYIDDTVEGIVHALGAPGKFDVYNIGNCRPVRVDAMVQALGRALDRPVRRKYLPTPAGEMLLTHADLSKSGQALGYSPKVNLEQGLQRFAEWLKTRS